MRAALLTTCTAEKSSQPGLLPAAERYRGWRVDAARAAALDAQAPLLFLSGVYGIVPATRPLPWYDHALQPGEVEEMIGPCAAQLAALGVVSLTALLLPVCTPGWSPYHRLLTAGCAQGG